MKRSRNTDNQLEGAVGAKLIKCKHLSDSQLDHLENDITSDSNMKVSDLHQHLLNKSSVDCPLDPESIGHKILELELRFSDLVKPEDLVAPVQFCYNPVEYAFLPHCEYLRKFGDGRKRVLFLGMNPGPYGMAQTGVPFGTVSMIQGWLGIEERRISRPERENPHRPVQGFNCTREEVSGTRFWSMIRDVCGTPETFARHCTVYNYCPLLFLSGTGKNISLAELPPNMGNSLRERCDEVLLQVLKLYKVEHLICIGRFAEKRALDVVRKAEFGLKIHYLMHPSPRCPAANKGWIEKTKAELMKMELVNLFRSDGDVT